MPANDFSPPLRGHIAEGTMTAKPNFDVTNPLVVVRLMCGLFYVPHVLFKLMGFDGSIAAFAKMGFEPALPWLLLAIATEAICAIGLTLNMYVQFVGLMSAGVMAFAVYGTFAAKGVHWMWNFGGVEYLAFWGVSSFMLAVQAWKQVLAGKQRMTAAFAHA
jgi:putative oxidoreductase